ncbi:MAG: carboxypeptidase regulatory-like domain-containing protein [Bacteroidales bacterium]|nr:carboxypeptidase regulatory-like domain-containing protein [Bacteroidales bacterium]
MKKLFFFALLFASISLTFGQHTINNSFFDHVNYIGAFGSEDWTSPWAEWDPVAAVYPTADSTISAGDITSNIRLSSGQSPLFGIQSFSNPRLSDGWFTPTNYVGAFDGTNDWTSPWAEFDPQNAVYPTTTVTVNAGNITANTTWTSANVYKLNGFVYVKSGVTLTIQPGTIIRGDETNKGTLIIERGGKLIAQGTAAQPIVFTSNKPAGFRGYGDWGGVILCGKATINVPGGEATIEGGVGAQFGGGATPDDNDDSGILEYVRIEFCGIEFEPNNEINGLTLGGVGKGTKIDYVQVSYGGDDSYEWFGGTVDAKHLIAFSGWDDDFDTDFGFTGRIQFGVVLRDPDIADPGSGSNAFESDNDGSGSGNLPLTRPFFSNISVFGPLATTSTSINQYYLNAMHLRRNSAISIYNSIISGYPNGLRIQSPSTNQANSNNLQLENVVMSGMRDSFFYDSFNEDYFIAASRNNSILTSNSSLKVNDPFNLTNPNFLLQNGSRVYKLDGWVYVKSGTTLTIDPGTIFRCTEKSGPGPTQNQGAAIIVERGGKIVAEGTPQKPIIFTSSAFEGVRARGDWGGIIILGYATINQPGGTSTIEGGVGSIYGGGLSPNDNDNSGILKYVRIEFAGSEFASNNEINGLTMGGVGSETVLDYIQVSYGDDDSYEWFGGTVNAKHLISYKVNDDDFDGDEGWQGLVQYGVALRDPALADVSGSNGFEISNHGPSTYLPVTHPIFSNITVMVDGPSITDPDFGDAINLKDNTEIGIYNVISCGWPTGLDFSGSGVEGNAAAGLLDIENTILAQHASFFDNTPEQTFFSAPARDNETQALCSYYMLNNPFVYNNNSDFTLMDDSPLWHRSRWTYSLSGTVTYDNAGNTAFPNVTITISPVSGSKGFTKTATTNASGQYSFPRIGNGTYNVTVSTTTPWPNAFASGVDASDGFLIQQHFLGNITLTALKLKAAETNGITPINTGDALSAVRRGISLVPFVWGPNDWIFDVPSIVVNDANITGKNFKGIAVGDTDGSYIP